MKLTAFHFTNAPEFGTFDLACIGSWCGHDEPVRGFFFTTNERYEGNRTEGDAMRRMVVEIELVNPFFATGYDAMDAFGLDQPGATGATVRENLIAAGFDGVIFAGGDEIVALHPEQVRIIAQHTP